MLEQLEQGVVDQRAWEQFNALGLPSKEREVYRYVRLSDLYSHSFRLADRVIPSLASQDGRLVFVNGRYVEALSTPPSEIVVLPFKAALKTYGAFLNPRHASQIKEESDPFAALNGALAEEALFVYLPPKSVSRFEVVHLVTEHAAPVVTTPRLHICAGKEAEAKCFLIHKGPHWVNSFVDIALDERAAVTMTTIMDHTTESWQFDAIRATLKRESRLKTYAVSNGGATVRQDYKVQLLEEGAEAALYGVCQVAERRHHHVHVLMEHRAPHCRSFQHFKNVLKGTSRTSFEGKIYVHQAAQKTEAFQSNPNLILGRHAFANSKPNLEIFADDVKASHGSTVGQLDEEQLFYLKTRGVPQKAAKSLLVHGFCQEILDQIEKPYADLCRFS
ncbi:MAG: FeS cluster assembly protein SufD [Chlamydiales bacterium]|nr:FeS cluster assembly protein SufD [Chlamydiales bacterium]